jgi:hypothetical protein
MAVITVMPMPDPFPLHHFVCQFVGVRSFGYRGVGINREPYEDGGTDHRSPDKKIPRPFFLHREPPFKVFREWLEELCQFLLELLTGGQKSLT